jgi:SPP1 family predicted phage head-tail adaptor
MQRAAGTAGIGQPSKTFVFVREAWANVKFQSGAEVVRAGAETSVVKASIRIRACADIDVGWRVTYGSWMFDVKAPPLPDQDPQFAFLVCEAVK